MKYKIIILICILICSYIASSYYINLENLENFELLNPYDIPVVVICWNNLTFIKNFVNQLKKYKNPIILLDNNSTYTPLLEYYNEINKELKDRITIILLDQNYGHTIYLKLKHILPIYILSDPDLELNINMPDNFAEIFLNLSYKYKSYKVGSALNIEDHNNFINCPNYTNNLSIYEWESQFWINPIQDDDNYQLYKADIDTTFCLINNNFKENNIRVAGNFTVKHLPWYKDYIKNNFVKSEIEHWKKNNISSSILFTCLEL